MDFATEDSRGYHGRALSDPPFLRDPNLFQADEDVYFSNPMGSGRREARVVCESFGSGRKFASGAHPKMRQVDAQKSMKPNYKRRSMAYSRNPLLACFVGESVLSSRNIHLAPGSDTSGGSQRTFFSLIPVDRSRVNERTGEPQSPQLSCIGQVKHKQVKVAKTAEVVTEDLARMDINDGVIPQAVRLNKTTSTGGQHKEFKFPKQDSFKFLKEESFRVHKGESFRMQKVESFKLRREESFKVQKEESFKHQKEESLKLQKEMSLRLQRKEKPVEVVVDEMPPLDLAGDSTSEEDVPPLDTNGVNNAARLMRSKRAVEEDKKPEDVERVNSPSQRNSIRHFNHFLKQKLGASMVRSGFVCGWSSGEESPRSERSETESEHYEIDLSRFASGDFQPKTPSFRELMHYQHTKKLAEIRVHSQTEGVDRGSWKDEMQGKQQNDISINAMPGDNVDSSTIVIKCSPSTVILQPATEASLWKRRCMQRPLTLEVRS